MSRLRGSRRRYAVELVAIAIAIGLIILLLLNGGPSAFGRWFAELIGAP